MKSGGSGRHKHCSRKQEKKCGEHFLSMAAALGAVALWSSSSTGAAQVSAVQPDPEPLITKAYRYALPVYEIARLRYRQSFDPNNRMEPKIVEERS
jgi:hypothetical protein